MTKHAYLLAGLVLLSQTALAATPFGTTFTNTASANYNVGGVPTSNTSSASITTNGRTPPQISFLQYVPSGSAGAIYNVNPNSCGASTLNNAAYPPSTSISLPGSVRLAPASVYSGGDPTFVRVLDIDQNLNAAVIETISISITATNGDIESITLTETGVSTGEFIGYIPSSSAAVAANNCTLNVSNNIKITATYIDPLDGTPAVASNALYDPFGVIFDSTTGNRIDGAIVRIVDAATNLDAPVFCDDGVTPLPQPLTSGSATVCDPASPGAYRFPRMAVGTYRIIVTPPAGFTAPSTVPIASLPAGFVVVGPLGTGASYGGSFVLPAGPPIQVDFPIDSAAIGTDLQMIKVAEKTLVGEGEFVPYTITIKNLSAANANNVPIRDVLPTGFRYQKGSAKRDSVKIADPTILNDGRSLTFNVGNIVAGGSITLRYVVEVTGAAKPGKAENIALAGGAFTSNTARASVTVREDLMRSRGILMGRVVVGSCDDRVDNDDKGLANARILLEDGTYILTDANGRWHADNILPGTHVVQLDTASLPKGYQVMDCQQNTRFAGRNYSQFVNLRGGSLWRADFYVQAPEKADATEHKELANVPGTYNRESATQPVKGDPPPQPANSDNRASLVETLPYTPKWIASAEPATAWLHPQANFVPALPVVKMAVQAAPDAKITIKVNGEAVNPLLYEGRSNNLARTTSLALWNAVPIKEGDNVMEVTITDKTGAVILQEKRIIHHGSSPVRAELVPQNSRLIADGNTQPIIAVRILDKDGKPVRRGLNGVFQINEPYITSNQIEAIQRDPLAGKVDNKPRYEVGVDGIALIPLAPTTQSGEVVLSFDFGNQSLAQQNTRSNVNNGTQVRTWLSAGERDWVLVGFAQGTAAHKKISGNVKAAKADNADEDLMDKDRVAFYAKGTVKGDTLLTIAYDTAKQRGNAGAQANLKQMIDPTRYYTLYADATQPYFDAASARKLYLKVERKQFYAMFGDYDTGLTLTEFSRYSRTLNGIKSAYQGDKVSYNAFATKTAQAFKRDEMLGNGTSGTYRLSSRAIIENTEKIRIEVRDRFRNEVIIKTQNMARFIDYDIDYNLGTLFFRQPIASRDNNLNPTYIVAEYEANDSKDEKVSAGGRVAVKPNDKSEIGLSAVHEGNIGNKGDLQGVDARYQVGKNTTLVGEVANSKREVAGTDAKGQAWKAEILHQDEKLDAKAYIHQQDEGFGLGQQAAGEVGTRKIGADARYQIDETKRLQGQIYQQDNLSTGGKRDVIEGRMDQKIGEKTEAYYGARMAKDKDGAGNSLDSNQAIGGISYKLLDNKLTLRGGAELGFDNQSTDFPDRYRVGADYALNAQAQMFAEHEIARGETVSADTTRLGIRLKPWTGGELAASLGNERSLDSQRMYSDLGLVQRWQINERWQVDGSIDRVQTLRAKTSAQNLNVPLASGSYGEDSDAVSLGANYNNKAWSANTRIELRNADTQQSRNLLLGAQRNLSEGRVLAGGLSYKVVDANLSESRKLDARLSYASRPDNSDWAWLNRFDYIDEFTDSGATSSHARKFVNNSNLNWMPNRRTQIAFQYGGKYVMDTIDGDRYAGYTDLMSVLIQRDIGKNWDIGAHVGMLRSQNSGTRNSNAGISLGYKLMQNTWVSIGYNFMGFDDRDFAGAEYRSKGVYFTIRTKFDQDTFNLNKLTGNDSVKAAVSAPN